MNPDERLEMGSGVAAAKAELRKAISISLKGLSEESIKEQSRVVSSKLFALPEYQKAKSLSIFLSMPAGEIVTQPIVEHAFDHQKAVFIPYLRKNQTEHGPRSVMDMVELHSIDDFHKLLPDKWSIPSLSKDQLPGRKRCPGDHENGSQHVELDLVLMPGVAFDKSLRRIGHGKGYYDFFLRRYSDQTGLEPKSSPLLVALALQQQVLPDGENIPTDETDWPIDILISGDGQIRRPSIDE